MFHSETLDIIDDLSVIQESKEAVLEELSRSDGIVQAFLVRLTEQKTYVFFICGLYCPVKEREVITG